MILTKKYRDHVVLPYIFCRRFIQERPEESETKAELAARHQEMKNKLTELNNELAELRRKQEETEIVLSKHEAAMMDHRRKEEEAADKACRS